MSGLEGGPRARLAAFATRPQSEVRARAVTSWEKLRRPLGLPQDGALLSSLIAVSLAAVSSSRLAGRPRAASARVSLSHS